MRYIIYNIYTMRVSPLSYFRAVFGTQEKRVIGTLHIGIGRDPHEIARANLLLCR